MSKLEESDIEACEAEVEDSYSSEDDEESTEEQ